MKKLYPFKIIKNSRSSLFSLLLTACLWPLASGAQILPDGCQKFLGNIYSSKQTEDFTNYWNQVTPENAGKWGSVEGTRDVMNWTELDAAYALAKDNGFPFRFHVLIWGNQQPEWIKTLPAAEQLEEIKEWYAAVAERYPDIDYLEVVNEPVNDPPFKNDAGGGFYAEALGGQGPSGYDWIITSFKLAREYFPDTKLVLNEFNVTNTTDHAKEYVNIINLLKAENLIDIVGIQGHAFETSYQSGAKTKTNLDLIAATGLPIMITEMDIDGSTPEQQLEEYKEIFPVFWEHPSVIGVTLWGWRPGLWRDAQGAALVTSTGTEKPALVWLKTYLMNDGAKFCSTNPENPEPETPTGIKENRLQRDINIYPNPSANGSFKLVLTNESYDQIKILDISGKIIRTVDIKGEMESLLDLDLKPGIYSVQLINKNVTAGKKLMVR